MFKNYLDAHLHVSSFWGLQCRRYRSVPLGLVLWVTEAWDGWLHMPVELRSEQGRRSVALERRKESQAEKTFAKNPEMQMSLRYLEESKDREGLQAWTPEAIFSCPM